tara:strand:- start:848 stop:1222 length:375 start_codon:yes stop_codon:yes gene_type:complete
MTKNSIFNIFTIALAIFLQDNGALAQLETPESSRLIVAEGWQNVQANCTECHSSLLITQNSGSRIVWESRIRWMQNTQGLKPLDPKVEESILNYLATNYGQKSSSRRAPLNILLMPNNPFQPED